MWAGTGCAERDYAGWAMLGRTAVLGWAMLGCAVSGQAMLVWTVPGYTWPAWAMLKLAVMEGARGPGLAGAKKICT